MPGSQTMLSLRTLTLSLLLTIIIASVGSGLLLDKLYSELYSELYSSEQANKDLSQSQLEAIGAQLSAILRKLENKEEFIQAWQEENPLFFLR